MADNQVRLQNEASVRAGEGQQQQQHLNQHQGQHQQRQQYDRSTSGDSRAGFEEYWREEKESERAGRLQFVNEGPPYHHQSSSSPLDHQSQQLSGEGEGGEQERQGSCEYFVSFSFILLFFSVVKFVSCKVAVTSVKSVFPHPVLSLIPHALVPFLIFIFIYFPILLPPVADSHIHLPFSAFMIPHTSLLVLLYIPYRASM